MSSLLTNLPFKFHWLLVVLMGLVIPLATLRTEKPGEFYPFSNFPMYSRFEPDTYYVYVKDTRDQVVPVGTQFGRSISDLKKTYDRKLATLKSKAKLKQDKLDLPAAIKDEAARDALQWLVSITPKGKQASLLAHEGLVLYEVRIVFDEGRIKKTSTAVGRIRLGDPAAAPQP